MGVEADGPVGGGYGWCETGDGVCNESCLLLQESSSSSSSSSTQTAAASKELTDHNKTQWTGDARPLITPLSHLMQQEHPIHCPLHFSNEQHDWDSQYYGARCSRLIPSCSRRCHPTTA